MTPLANFETTATTAEALIAHLQKTILAEGTTSQNICATAEESLSSGSVRQHLAAIRDAHLRNRSEDALRAWNEPGAMATPPTTGQMKQMEADEAMLPTTSSDVIEDAALKQIVHEYLQQVLGA